MLSTLQTSMLEDSADQSCESDDERDETSKVQNVKDLLGEFHDVILHSEKYFDNCRSLKQALANLQKIPDQGKLFKVLKDSLSRDAVCLIKLLVLNGNASRTETENGQDYPLASSILMPRVSAMRTPINDSHSDWQFADITTSLEDIKQLMFEFESKFRTIVNGTNDIVSRLNQLNSLTDSNLMFLLGKVGS